MDNYLEFVSILLENRGYQFLCKFTILIPCFVGDEEGILLNTFNLYLFF